ncbi:cytidine deaminase [Actinomarinicola tropica]|uniref:Cytidine deaminase n=1 Tax=Actinomarinicola tropica TaxID=2789776 RepID=A0A5Q2RHZ0_9ACTN|nr:cytidine deaminase [Actinomarinicola tropica]QGG95423.1 cytidine deaminase [Actinomarinicola tropica]
MAADDALIAAAAQARERAYAPYSGFRMGAAVRTDAGEVLTGALVENVSLGLAMCAERAALFASVAAGARPERLVLVAPRTDGRITMPCGACLQVALELGGPDLEVTAATPEGDEESATLRDLLPRGPRKG